MDKDANRVLAYTKSTEITDDELSNVSGGNKSLMTRNTSVKVTGNPLCDSSVDVVFDW